MERLVRNTDVSIVGRRSELTGGLHPFSQKSGAPPTLTKNILLFLFYFSRDRLYSYDQLL
jgi:hypothetical protein